MAQENGKLGDYVIARKVDEKDGKCVLSFDKPLVYLSNDGVRHNLARMKFHSGKVDRYVFGDEYRIPVSVLSNIFRKINCEYLGQGPLEDIISSWLEESEGVEEDYSPPIEIDMQKRGIAGRSQHSTNRSPPKEKDVEE